MTDRLFPTPARLTLLAHIDAGRVFRDLLGDSYISAGRKVTAEMRDMEAAGWVDLLPGTGCRTWRLAPLGRAIRVVRVLEREDGRHIVAEVGDGDEPRVLGHATKSSDRRLTAHGAMPPRRGWLVKVGDLFANPQTVHEAREELRHMAASLLAAESTTVQEGQTP